MYSKYDLRRSIKSLQKEFCTCCSSGNTNQAYIKCTFFAQSLEATWSYHNHEWPPARYKENRGYQSLSNAILPNRYSDISWNGGILSTPHTQLRTAYIPFAPTLKERLEIGAIFWKPGRIQWSPLHPRRTQCASFSNIPIGIKLPMFIQTPVTKVFGTVLMHARRRWPPSSTIAVCKSFAYSYTAALEYTKTGALYAVKWAVEEWRLYLLDRHFIIKTDHAISFRSTEKQTDQMGIATRRIRLWITIPPWLQEPSVRCSFTLPSIPSKSPRPNRHSTSRRVSLCYNWFCT